MKGFQFFCVFGVLAVFLPFGLPCAFSPEIEDHGSKTLHWLKTGEYCNPGYAPDKTGRWVNTEPNVIKICPFGTSCRSGACNCNDLDDGTLMAMDGRGGRNCKRIAGQPCSNDNQCFNEVNCVEGICRCAATADFCVDKKMVITIMT